MRRSFRAAALFVVASVVALGAVTQATAAQTKLPKPGPGLQLDFYSAVVSTEQYRDLLSKGYDIAAAEDVFAGVQLSMVLTPSQVGDLQAQGIRTSLIRNKAGRTARQEAAAQKSTGYEVWRDYDGPDGYAAEIQRLARMNRDIAKAIAIGRTGQGRTIWAIRLTEDDGHGHGHGWWKKRHGHKHGHGHKSSKPRVLYSAMQHAREWIAGETDWRLLNYYIDRYRAKDKTIRKLLKETELWFVPVMNPDGYQYTFLNPGTRLWRKTLRDNNGNGTIEVGDGVDPNRNYPEHWNYDNEGSSNVFSSDTYRGPFASSEPETRAITRLLDRKHFKFQINYHSFGEWLLYPEGWQISTATADDPIYYALSGNLDNPAIDGFHPGLSSDVLYVTNGETTDYAHVNAKTLAWTPELGEGTPGSGFVFPDDEALVQAEFERNIPFALDVAKSAKDPENPVSHLGLETKDFYLNSEDTYKTGVPGVNFAFPVSYGDPQEVRILARRSLGKVEVKYKINGGSTKTASTYEWNGGEKYGGQTDVYYHVLGGFVRGTKPGDSVKVWFESKHEKSPSFTYSAVSETNRRVLVLSAEDYSGASPVQTPGPHYLQYYLDALQANGIQADVYDVDANGRKAPDALGVLSHYDAVVWYTGDDVVTREPGRGPGNGSRLSMDELLEARDFMNEGGRVLYTGSLAGAQYTPNLGTQLYDPTAANGVCNPTPAGQDPRRCLALFGSGDAMNDVLEYWFGAYLMNLDAGLDADGNAFGITGVDDPFTSLDWTLNGTDSAQNQFDANSFITTSGILPLSEYPQFESWAAAKYDRPGGPFDPHTGDGYAYSQIADVSYKRLSKTFTVPAGGGELSFWTSYNTEADWDMVFVEAHTVGQDNWTTLPDLNGHTTQATGESCKAENSGGWRTLHPFLDHYQTQDGDSNCLPTGTTGAWNAANGDSHGWQQWRVSLNAYAGQQVEVSISYASDWATQGLGVFVDDVIGPDGSTTSFETALDGWTVPGQPAGSAPNANDWIRTTAAGFPEGAVVATPDSLYMGFGFEGISDAATRKAVMGRAMNYLLGP
jgi:hypothetical protein